MRYEIYTDGSTLNNGQSEAKGGYAYAIYCDDKLLSSDCGGSTGVTNQQMEILAAINGLKAFKKNVIGARRFFNCVLYSDSAYLINCVNQRWYEKWQSNGWINSKGQPVANKELWQEIVPFFEEPNITFKKVKGHSGVDKNEYVDKMAREAAQGA